mgnify:CR=1 FL=1
MKKYIYNTPAFRYIFEIIVIVFSVTLSFYIQDVLNDRENIELKNESLEGVLADLKEDLDGFNAAHKTLSNRIEVSEKFLSGEVSNESINKILLTYGFLGIDSNYKSLVSTGAIEYINDELLIKELTSYYEISYSLLKDLSGQYKHFYLDLFDFMSVNYPIKSMEKLILIDNKIDSARKTISLNYDRKTLLKLQKNHEFKNRVYSMKRIVVVFMLFYEQAIDRNKKLSQLIKQELKN